MNYNAIANQAAVSLRAAMTPSSAAMVALALITSAGEIGAYLDRNGQLVTRGGLPIAPYTIPQGLYGDGVHDDAPAINRALLTGKSVILPRPPAHYFVGSGLAMSTTAAAQHFLAADAATKIVAASSVEKILSLRARSQVAGPLRISGSGLGAGRTGIYIGPNYVPHWTIFRVFVENCGYGIENHCPGSEPAASGSDAGGLFSSELTFCDVGFLAYGNQDKTVIDATSCTSCPTAGVKVMFGGGVTLRGGVQADNGVSVWVESGLLNAEGVHFEDRDNTGSDVTAEVGVNCRGTFNSCQFQTGGLPGFEVRTAAGAIVDLLGTNNGLVYARSNGTSFIRDFGAAPCLVDYNGAFTFRAGPWNAYNALPNVDNPGDVGTFVDGSLFAGQTVALVSATTQTLHYCARTGASAYEWRELGL